MSNLFCGECGSSLERIEVQKEEGGEIKAVTEYWCIICQKIDRTKTSPLSPTTPLSLSNSHANAPGTEIRRTEASTTPPEGQELVTMLNLNSKPEKKSSLALTSSHATYGWLTPHLQSVRPSCSEEDGSLLNQEASNALFQPFHYWKPCPIEQCPSNPTVTLNFYRYLLKGVPNHASMVSGQFSSNNHYISNLFIVFDHDFWLSSKPEYTIAKGIIPLKHEGIRVLFTPLNTTL